jgi:hypothetical protein
MSGRDRRCGPGCVWCGDVGSGSPLWTCGPVFEAPCGGGAGLGRDRPRVDPPARWRAAGTIQMTTVRWLLAWRPASLAAHRARLNWDRELRVSERARQALELMRVAMEKYGNAGQPLSPVALSSLYGACLAGEERDARIWVITLDASVHGWAAVLRTSLPALRPAPPLVCIRIPAKRPAGRSWPRRAQTASVVSSWSPSRRRTRRGQRSRQRPARPLSVSGIRASSCLIRK